MRQINLVLLVLLAGLGDAYADDSPRTEPLEHMKVLHHWQGYWQMTLSHSEDGGETWTKERPEIVNFDVRQQGMAVLESPKHSDKPSFHIETYFAYDQYRDVYRAMVVDTLWGLPDVYEGVVEDGNLVLTNLRAATGFPMADGVRNFKLIIPIEGNERTMQIMASDDGGTNWIENFTAFYRRLRPLND